MTKAIVADYLNIFMYYCVPSFFFLKAVSVLGTSGSQNSVKILLRLII